jgi:TorA maturation chaperone TorD
MSTRADETAASADAEEQARANVYALLARLFAAPPDDALLQGIAAGNVASDAPEDGDSGEFARAWHDLVHAAGETSADAVSEEYRQLFVGSGRAEISLYVSAYGAGSGVDSPLVALRDFLAAHGLTRRSGVFEPEDHIAMLLEVMRYLIGEQRDNIDDQQLFFSQFIQSGGASLCNAIFAHPEAHFFRHLALLTKSFLCVEQDAFAM